MSETWLKYAIPAVVLAAFGYTIQSLANVYATW